MKLELDTGSMMKAGQRSWRTTVIGAVSAIAILWPMLSVLFDGDPSTDFVYDSEKVKLAATALGLGWFVRDHGVSSEQAGIK